MKNLVIAAICLSICTFEFAQNGNCAEEEVGQVKANAKNSEDSLSIKQELETLSNQSNLKRSKEAKEVMQKSLADLDKSAMVTHVLPVGAYAPDFALPNAANKIVRLKSLLSKGPVVLTFYRGGWCPYCNLTLRALQKSLPAIEAENASLVAISPQLPDSSLSTVEKDKLTFEVLSDSGNKVAKQFGIAYEISSDLNKLYKEFGIDLAKDNGDESRELPLAATFVIAKNGSIANVFADVDYKKRMEPADVVTVLKRIRNEDRSRLNWRPVSH
ncbi:peroxiredoxin-like family protein [soil metagenome]